MKQNKQTTVAVATLGMMVLVAPLMAGAQLETRAAEAQARLAAGRSFSCDTITTMENKALAAVDERSAKMTGPSTNRATELAAQKAARLAQLESKRSEHETKRNDRYEAMRAKASTTAQKAAVEDFVDTVESLVDTRQEAIDAAIAEFEAGVAALRGEQSTVATDLSTEIKSDIRAIYDDAKAACTDTSTAAEIRTIITTGMQEMKSSRQANRGAYSFKEEFEALRADRQAAEKAAIAAFQSGMKEATADLKAALTY